MVGCQQQIHFVEYNNVSLGDLLERLGVLVEHMLLSVLGVNYCDNLVKPQPVLDRRHTQKRN